MDFSCKEKPEAAESVCCLLHLGDTGRNFPWDQALFCIDTLQVENKYL